MCAFRTILGICITLAALFSSGCAEDATTPAYGQLAGSVTVVGDPLPNGDGSGEIFLLRNPDDPKRDALRREGLQGGPRAYTFHLEAVPRGTYYLEACLRYAAGVGCVPYTLDPSGHPTAVVVHSGRPTEVQIRF